MDPTRPAIAQTPRRAARAARAARARAARFPGFNGGSDAAWLELGGRELRLHTDDGAWLSSIALPDPHAAMGRLEFAARELAGLDGSADGEDEDGEFVP